MYARAKGYSQEFNLIEKIQHEHASPLHCMLVTVWWLRVTVKKEWTVQPLTVQ